MPSTDSTTHTDLIFSALHSWLYVALVLALSLTLYLVTVINAGRARGRTKLEAPATTGNPEFERYYRVQMNTLEQIVPFIPALLMFSAFFGPKRAALLGAAWLIGRVLYMMGYYKDPSKRMAGFVISQLSTAILVAGSLFGVIKAMI